MKQIKNYCTKHLIILISISLVLTLVNMCTLPDDNKKSPDTQGGSSSKDSIDDFLTPHISSLPTAPQKEGLLSEKEAALRGFKYAIRHGYLENVKNEFPLTYTDLTLGDMFLVEDPVNGDYYFAAVEHRDGTLALIVQIDARTGDILSCGVYHSRQRIRLHRQDDIQSSIRRTFQKEVFSVQPVFISAPGCYSPLYHWHYIVAFKDAIPTRSGSRTMAVVSPFFSTSSRSTDDAGFDRYTIRFFKHQGDEQTILSNTDRKTIYHLEEMHE